MSALKAAQKLIEHGTVHKSLNVLTYRQRDEVIGAAAAAADARWSAGQQLSSIDGHLIAIKDNISTSELPTSCASSILKGYQSPYEATVITKLKSAGAIPAAKANLDEFGMGSHSINSIFGSVKQNTDVELSAGGSSGGSALAVATKSCTAALGTDTGGSIRLPAAYSGVIGFKPSYGMVSRHGVVAYANSLDTVGVMGAEIGEVKKVFDAIRGYDAKDPTSLPESVRSKLEDQRTTKPRQASLRIGVPLEYNTSEIEPEIRLIWQQVLSKLSHDGHEIVSVSLPSTKLALAAYYVLAPAEASSNLAKYDGVRYGNPASDLKNESNVLFATARGERLGEEVQRRILLGSFTLSAAAIDNYFMQAQRARRLIQKDFDTIFAFPNMLQKQSSASQDGVDLLLAPTAPSFPPKLSQLAQRTSLASYTDDVLTVPASLAGLPAISIPTHIKDRETRGSVGIQLMGQYGDDDMLLNAAEELQSSLWHRTQR